MLPPDRKQDPYALSNLSAGGASSGFLALCEEARDSGSNEKLIRHIDGLDGLAVLQAIQDKRWVRFNPSNLNGTGTLEMRFPPPSLYATAAKHWVVWVLSFGFAALNTDWSQQRPLRDAASVSHLRNFVLSGYRKTGLEKAAVMTKFPNPTVMHKPQYTVQA